MKISKVNIQAIRLIKVPIVHLIFAINQFQLMKEVQETIVWIFTRITNKNNNNKIQTMDNYSNKSLKIINNNKINNFSNRRIKIYWHLSIG